MTTLAGSWYTLNGSMQMAFDIYGERLRPGHCEVHPHAHEEYPCSICLDVTPRQRPAVTDPLCDICKRHKACARSHVYNVCSENCAWLAEERYYARADRENTTSNYEE